MSKPSRKTNRSPLAQWIYNTVWRQGLRVKYQQRGNTLLILCEGISCPDRNAILTRLLLPLQSVDLNRFMAPGQPQIYQLVIYGRRVGQPGMGWSYSIHLNQIDRHLDQLRHLHTEPTRSPSRDSHRTATSTVDPPAVEAALLVPNRTLARQGDPDSIARYLSETLGRLGVAVNVRVKTLPYSLQSALSVITPAATDADRPTLMRRLWITCEAPYSPDPVLIGEPVTQQLRELELDGFRDAVVQIRVQGEERADWVLRVDLTPASEMLREWARWGDVEAIAHTLKQALLPTSIHLSTASLQNATLHLFFSAIDASDIPPDQDRIKAIVVPLLETLGPQGVHAATLYGQVAGQETPAWVDWLDLPASKHSALAESPMSLAEHGDWGAIAFLLSRLLNPDLEQYLTTGGIRTQILPRQDLLHIMNDAPVCPVQSQVGPTVAQFFKQLQLPGVAGIRVYGRRSGQKQPLWCYGKDLAPRQRFVPEAPPEFAATDAFVGELLAPADDAELTPDLTPDDLRSAWTHLCATTVERLQAVLVGTHLCQPIADGTDRRSLPAADPAPDRQGVALALVWGVAGLLLMVQLDWGFRRLLNAPAPPDAGSDTAQAAAIPDPEPRGEPAPTPAPAVEAIAPDISLQASEDEADIFNTSMFTQVDGADGTASVDAGADPAQLAPVDLPYTPPSPADQAIARAVVGEDPDFSTFNSRQLDEKIQLYFNYVEQWGAPDVLIVGSSRALRGVDPAALQQGLSELGYPEVRVFNFGINGATAQVVDLVLRQLVRPDHLPRLVIWADGARAFNSGAVDVTFNGVTASEGYRELVAGQLPTLTSGDVQPANNTTADIPGTTDALSGGIGSSLTASYQHIDRWMSDRLAVVSTAHDDRDRLKQILKGWVTTLMPERSPLPVEATLDAESALESPSLLVAGQDGMDLNGFLPLAVRFNPATYYQQYARVPGAYDGDYEGFRVEGKQDESLRSLLAFTQSHQIPVVFVNLPLTDDYLDATRGEYEQVFREYLTRMSLAQTGLIFRDLSEAWLTDYDYFSDPSHLNRYGAYQVAQRLVQDPMVPWNRVQP